MIPISYRADQELYVTSLNGKNKKRIAGNVASDFYAYNNNLYYIKDNQIEKFNFSSGKTVSISVTGILQNPSTLNIQGMEGNILYCTESNSVDMSDHMTVYKINLKKKKGKKIAYFESVEPIHSMAVASDQVYLTTGTGAGNGFAKIVKGSSNYDSYYKKYNSGGYVAFYRNYIVMDNYKYDSNELSEVFAGYVKMVKIKLYPLSRTF